MNNRLFRSVIVILTFLFAVYGKRTLGSYSEIVFESQLISILYSYAWWIIPVFLVVGSFYGYQNVLKELCLDKGLLIGAFFSIALVCPMFLGSAILGHIDADQNVVRLLHQTLFAGVMEEILFRGFLFGILFRKLRWGFVPASVLGAVIFASNHLYQGSNIKELVGIFLVTFIGSAWFAWLFIEWKENLWIPIFLHVLMNLSWTLFNVSDNALGGFYINIYRAITIALTVTATILYNIRIDKFRVNGKNLLFNRV